MESLSEITWDVVISGTGLQPSLLALALSRSGKNVLHVDPNSYYGGSEAAFSLQEADEWAKRHSASSVAAVYTDAHTTSGADNNQPRSSRAYSLALAPQLIHARSKLVTQLVSSKAFRQIEFMAVGSFFIYQPASEASSSPTLARIPSTREDVFSNKAISMRSKRGLMKFMKFVLDYESEDQLQVWKPQAETTLSNFLASEFKLDVDLQSYIVSLTLSLDGNISTQDGLAAISRHLLSMGAFGPGFAALYPKWGGLSEVAQVGCRAAAVGGAVYMLGTGIQDISQSSETDDSAKLTIKLSDDTVVNSKALVRETTATQSTVHLTRLTVVVDYNFPSLFEVVVEGAPTPSVGVVAFPAGSIVTDDTTSTAPVYVMVHSSDTGECPAKQCVLYLCTISGTASKPVLEKALQNLLASVADEGQTPKIIYQLSYEQHGSNSSISLDGSIVTFAGPPPDLAFNDSTLEHVRTAWDMVMSGDGKPENGEYMAFQDREGQGDEDAFDD